MRILYHHRTRSTDAQRIHILEMVKAFQSLGHEVEMVSLIPIDAGMEDAARDAGDATWKKLVRRIPFSYDLVQLGYNLVGIPMLLAACFRKRVDFIYERYSLWSYAGMQYARKSGVPGLLEVNAPLIEEQATYRTLVDRAGAERVADRVFGAATALIAVSQEVADYLDQYPAARGRIYVIPNGVDPDRFPEKLSPSRPGEPPA